MIEPPADGRLRFRSNIPPELCDVVARTVIRGHPQHINTVEVLNDELRTLVEILEPATPLILNNPAYQQAPLPPQAAPAAQASEMAQPRQFSPAGTRKVPSPLPTCQPGIGPSTFHQPRNEKSLASTMENPDFSDQTIADPSLMSAVPRPSMPYPHTQTGAQNVDRSTIILLLLRGLILFASCFAFGFYVSSFL